MAAFWLWTPDIGRDDLEARYLASEADLMEIGGTRLHVRNEGNPDAPAVILLHGFGSHLQTWDGWAAPLAAQLRVIRLDLPGSGLSPPDATGDYTDERSLALVLALMDNKGVGRASLVGNSIGGRIAWRFAASHPDRVDRLVLVSPDGFASPGFEYRVAPEVPVMLQAMRFVLPKSMLRQNLAIAYADPERLTQETLDRYHDLMRAPGAREALLARMAQTVLVPPEPLLRAIRAPVLLLWGDRDRMIPVTNADDYLANLASARLVRLPGLGHVPQEEDPLTSVGPVVEFLTRPQP